MKYILIILCVNYDILLSKIFEELDSYQTQLTQSHTQLVGMNSSIPTQCFFQKKHTSISCNYFNIKFVPSKNQNREIFKYCSNGYVYNSSGTDNLLRYITSCLNRKSDLVTK